MWTVKTYYESDNKIFPCENSNEDLDISGIASGKPAKTTVKDPKQKKNPAFTWNCRRKD